MLLGSGSGQAGGRGSRSRGCGRVWAAAELHAGTIFLARRLSLLSTGGGACYPCALAAQRRCDRLFRGSSPGGSGHRLMDSCTSLSRLLFPCLASWSRQSPGPSPLLSLRPPRFFGAVQTQPEGCPPDTPRDSGWPRLHRISASAHQHGRRARQIHPVDQIPCCALSGAGFCRGQAVICR